jgi:outer membrane protein assembly factor BamB
MRRFGRLCSVTAVGWTLAAMSLPLAATDGTSVVRSVAGHRSRSPQAGLCVEIGGDAWEETVQLAERYVVHRLDRDPERVARWQRSLTEAGLYGRVVVEHWEHEHLPHADRLANLLIVREPSPVQQAEFERVLAPGGGLEDHRGAETQRSRKSNDHPSHWWTHQWRDATGNLATETSDIGIPTGLQWIDGPLFAMAGRKTSTQSLVSAAGRNFYITQNVPENLLAGAESAVQMLVARDAFNGLELWRRPWPGENTTVDGETNPRLVATADRLWLAGPTTILGIDPATGQTQVTIPVGGPVSSLSLLDQLLLVQLPQQVVGIEGDRLVWRRQAPGLQALAGQPEQLVLLTRRRDRDGSFGHHLTSLHPADGQPLWQVDVRPQTEVRQLRIAWLDQQTIGLTAEGQLHQYRAADGRHLWSRTTEARPGKAYVDERFVGHHSIGGRVWLLAENSPRDLLGQKRWLQLDPLTGEELGQLTTSGPWPETAAPAKLGCQRILASSDFFMIPRQATFVDVASGQKHSFKFLRGGCGLGFVPANGLIYTHPHACGCFSEALRGFMAAHSAPPPTAADVAAMHSTPAIATPEQLERAQQRWSAGAPQLATNAADTPPADWPMHRGDAYRSGSGRAQLKGPVQVRWIAQVTDAAHAAAAAATEPTEPAGPTGPTGQQGWQLRLGPPLTAPSVMGSQVLVAEPQTHRVTARDTQTGQLRWSFTAGGRIDSPPTIDRGLCWFGAHDGYVYCLDTADGQLLWKRRVAPSDRRIVAFGQVESAWPVAGSPLLHQDALLVAAGRAADADGGIFIWCLDPVDGSVNWTRQINHDVFGVEQLLVADGPDLFYANWRLAIADGRGGPLPLSQATHLRGGKMGLLESSWTDLDLALRKGLHDWTQGGHTGQLLAFDPAAVVGFHMSEEGDRVLFCSQPHWETPLPQGRQAVGLALAGPSHLLVAESVRGSAVSTGWLRLLDRTTGATVQEIELPAPPNFDSLAVAREAIWLTLANGQLVCLESQP